MRRNGWVFHGLLALATSAALACGENGTAPDPPVAENRPPVATGTIPAQVVTVGNTVTVALSNYFHDPDGDELNYSAASSDAGVATVAISQSDAVVTGVSSGDVTITVTAFDGDGLSAQQAFGANVVPRGDPTVEFRIDFGTTPEGGTATLELDVRPSPESTIRVTYSFGNDGDPETADADQADYGEAGGAVRVQAGESTATVEIAVREDDSIEATREVFTVVLDAPDEGAGYQLGQLTTAVVTIEEGVCDRTPQVRDELLALTGLDQCNMAIGSDLAKISILDLRGPESEGADRVADRQGQDNRCGGAEGSASTWTKGEAPRIRPSGCVIARHPRAVRSLPQGSRTAAGTDAITELRAGDFAELTELEELFLSSNKLRELPAGVFAGLEELRYVNLAFNRLRELPEGLLSGLVRLEDFSAQENELIRLPSGLFTGLTRLREVWLHDNELVELPAGLFADAVDLENLPLHANRLQELPVDVFSGLDNLRYLSLGDNRITELDGAAFSDLSELEALGLSGNRLAALPSAVFADLGNLQGLWLERNRLEILQNGLFDGMPNLTLVVADSNRIANIEDGTFSNLDAIAQISLVENRLSELRKRMFSGLDGLVSLDLSRNRIDDLVPGVFSDLGSLEFLYLNYNPLTELKRDVFAGLENLQLLWLGSGGLERVQPGAFNGLSELTELSISETSVSGLADGTFDDLRSLETLFLHSNDISELKSDIFAELPRLRNLYIWDNLLTELPPTVFAQLTELEDLNLTQNRLVTLPSGVFSGLAKLTFLNVSRNGLTELADETFAGLYALGFLDLDKNPGAPFTLDVRLERTDTADLTAPGPATLVLSLPEGAPFSMRIPLSVEGGSLSAGTAVIESGKTMSSGITVTQSSGTQSGTRVVLGPAPMVPGDISGLDVVATDTIVLFATSGDQSGGEPGLAHSRERDWRKGIVVSEAAGLALAQTRRRLIGRSSKSNRR